MRIAVIGAGAVGSFYGSKLGRAGHDVHFLMRRDFEAVRRNGLTVRSCDGDYQFPAQVYAFPQEIGPADLVICSLKTTALDTAEALIRPCVGPDTEILALMNGLGVEELFAGWFGPERIYGGLAFVCINRGEPGIIEHQDYGRVTFGHFLDNADKAQRMADLFAGAGFETAVAPSLRQARWEKLVWNIPFSTLCVTGNGVTTRHIMEDSGLRELARRLMEETIAAANADGCSIDGGPLIAKMFANTATMGDYKPSMQIDYVNRRPIEVESILGEPLRRAAARNVPVPHIAMQYAIVSFLDRLNRGLVRR